MKEVKNMTVTKEDLERIGNSKCNNEEGFLTILCGETANIEEIFLRNILELYGYKITDKQDFWWGDVGDFDNVELEFTTNFPWKEYQKLFMSEVMKDHIEINDSLLNVDLKNGKYVLQYGWKKYGRGKNDFLNTQKVRVIDGQIMRVDIIRAAKIYQKKSGLLDDNWIESIHVFENGVIEYMTGS